MGKEQELAIVFADVVGSTKLYDSLGDQRARETVALCIARMRQATEKHTGTVIKTMGDEVMATFVDAHAALSAACEMQKNLTADPELQNDSVHIAIRIGCHFGSVTVENNDVFGVAVHTANRMTSQAKADQIVTTRAMVDRLSSEWQPLIRQIGVATVKGRMDEVELFEVLWQTDDITSLLPDLPALRAQKPRVSRLILRVQDHELILTEYSSSIVMGRAEDNALVVRGNMISRAHARIEVTKSQFLLVDQSTNGTFVIPEEGTEQFIRRDTYVLSGRGLIGFGRVPEQYSSLAIRYSVEGG